MDFLSFTIHATVWQFCRCVTFTSLCGFTEVRDDMPFTCLVFFIQPLDNRQSWSKQHELYTSCCVAVTSDKTAKSQAEHLVPLSAPSAKFPVRFQTPPPPTPRSLLALSDLTAEIISLNEEVSSCKKGTVSSESFLRHATVGRYWEAEASDTAVLIYCPSFSEHLRKHLTHFMMFCMVLHHMVTLLAGHLECFPLIHVLVFCTLLVLNWGARVIWSTFTSLCSRRGLPPSSAEDDNANDFIPRKDFYYCERKSKYGRCTGY